MAEPTVVIDGIAQGGAGVGRIDGKVVFVDGALPGEEVLVRIDETRSRYSRGTAIEVLEASPLRTEPPCPHFDSCGGCSWQMAAYEAQLDWKTEIVGSQLIQIGRLETDVARCLSAGEPFGYRNRLDLRTAGGKPALLARRSHTPVPLDVCLLAAGPIAEAVASIDGLPDGGRLTLRAGLRTGDTATIWDGPDPGIEAVSASDAVIFEEVAGRRFRISGRAFFQVNTGAAEILVDTVRRAADADPDVVVDVYAGGGLLGISVATARLISIEANRKAVADLRHNRGGDEDVLGMPASKALGKLTGLDVDVMIVDPPRSGIDAQTVNAMLAIRPKTLVSVSCDPATFARDARTLLDAGYRLDFVQPIDMFPQTPHVEIVGRFIV